MIPKISNAVCPGCRQRVTDLAQMGGGDRFTVGETADVMCFHCGTAYILELTPFGWVSREATPEEREEATRDPVFNHVRAQYALYRENPEGFWT